MDKNKFANLSMNRSAINCLNSHTEIVETIPAFSKVVLALKANVKEIDEAASQYELDITGITQDKKGTRLRLEEKALSLAGVVATHALENNDKELFRGVQCCASGLRGRRDEELLAFCGGVLQQTMAASLPLSLYGLSDQTLTDFENSITDFASAIVSPRTARSHRKALLQRLTQLFRQNRFIHKYKLAPLARLFKNSHPRFYNELVFSCRLPDPHTRHTQSAGTITDKSTGNPLHDVTVRVAETGQTITTDSNGNFKQRIPIPAFYTFIIEKEGYETVTRHEVEIRQGEITELNVELEKLV